MTTTNAPHSVAFALIRDAADLMDTVDPGTTTLDGHDYGPITLRVRRMYRPGHDTLTLIAYHGEDLVATVIAARIGRRVVARIHQIRFAAWLFTRTSDWGFTATATVAGRARRFILTGSRAGTWTLQANGEEPTVFTTLDDAAAHLCAAAPPLT